MKRLPGPGTSNEMSKLAVLGLVPSGIQRSQQGSLSSWWRKDITPSPFQAQHPTPKSQAQSSGMPCAHGLLLRVLWEAFTALAPPKHLH